MSDSHFQLAEGAQNPALEMLFTTNGVPQDLTGGTVTFSMKRKRTGVVKVNNGACTIMNPPGTDGRAKYAWAPTDADTPGVYYGRGKVTGLAGGPAYFPASGYIWVTVTPKASS